MTPITRRHMLALTAAGMAGPALSEPVFLNGMGVAIGGYDPVAYFEIEEAVKGSMDNELETKDALWHFSRPEYKTMFEAAPASYMPQFGGYCAEAMARGFKRRSDPTIWVLIDRKIYLHYSILDQNRWAEDIRGNIRMAEKNWKDLRDIPL